jgi:hypothetical protein
MKFIKIINLIYINPAEILDMNNGNISGKMQMSDGRFFTTGLHF